MASVPTEAPFRLNMPFADATLTSIFAMIATGQTWRDRFGIHDRISFACAAAGAAVLALHWASIIIFLFPRIGSLRFLRLHYTAEWGVDWVGAWWHVFTFPVLGCAVFFVNGALSGMLSKRRRLYASAVHVVTFAIQLSVAGAGVTAILLNS